MRRRSLLTGLALGGAGLAGCGLSSASGYLPEADPGSVRRVPSLEGVRIAVGSKNFTEQLILGKIAGLVLRAAGADVADRTNLPGSAAARRQQVNGEVDVQWEYTGTAWLSYLGQSEGIPDAAEQYEVVRAMDLADNQLVWLSPSAVNNTYAVATRSEFAAEFGLVRFSDVAGLPVEQRTFAVESEFASRNDGFVPMLETYGMPLGAPDGVPRENVSTLDTGVVYTATDSGQVNFGEVFATDGRIEALDLTVLEDDRAFFPAYNACLVARQDVLVAHPVIADVLLPVSDALTNDVLVQLNLQVDVEGREPADVALEWLRSAGFVS
ncbi:glycine betaine ABC transporter substrate-binding protein [Kineococcus sp. SYSU DK003]|uniref:glycine betaine ABC transporter substrate-binding protein n=1 Tax=Kineococcus sp. SYSU DK003 TaxID=3383124 RepID=UPI003D7E097C